MLFFFAEKYVQDYSMLKRTPFYREVWFLVTVAAGSMVIIILVVAVLCVKSKSYKYKREYEASLQCWMLAARTVPPPVHVFVTPCALFPFVPSSSRSHFSFVHPESNDAVICYRGGAQIHAGSR